MLKRFGKFNQVTEKLKNFDFEQDFNDMRKKKKKKRPQDPNAGPVPLITAEKSEFCFSIKPFTISNKSRFVI